MKYLYFEDEGGVVHSAKSSGWLRETVAQQKGEYLRRMFHGAPSGLLVRPVLRRNVTCLLCIAEDHDA